MRADPDRLSTWIPYRPSACDRCWAGCCRLPVEADAGDMVRLGLISPDEAARSLKKIARRLESEGVVRNFRASSGLFTLAQTPAGDCVYLHPVERRCTVYETRPSVCRRFPAEIGPRPGFCPMREKTPGDAQRLRSNRR